MTSEDVEELRGAFGVQDPNRDYNVIVDGFGTGLAPPAEDQLLSMVGVANVLDAIEADFEALPGAVNLSALPTFPAVGNQSSQPSCAAWAAAYYAYGFLEAVDNDWTLAPTGEPGQLISPAWTYARSNGGRDLGSSMDFNMMVIKDWGAATMATMPFDEREYLDLGSPSAFREAPAHRAKEVFTIDYSGPSTIEEIKLLVADGIPVTFAIDANEYSSGFSDGNHILSSSEYSSLTLNHAQTIVGYDDAVTDDGDVGAFWVVNSWGDGWGSDGFYWFTYGALEELGTLHLTYLNYVSDIEDYCPRLVANWHFNDSPSRGTLLKVGVGTPTLPYAVKEPFVVEDSFASHKLPTYMCLDITEFSSIYENYSDDFYLYLGPSPIRGELSSFKVESHDGEFVPGAANRSSGQSIDVPESTPGIAEVTFPRYDAIEADEAVDAAGIELTSITEVTWVPVEDGSAVDGDSMQSGDVGNGETTSLALSVVGPAVITFSWKVSSEEGWDTLSFSVPD
ncbi:MAG: C1 family peptidase, partial [Thermoplasmata archaeon]|nr:C1 family peptidase [Thermoplasmata archaeon]